MTSQKKEEAFLRELERELLYLLHFYREQSRSKSRFVVVVGGGGVLHQ